MTRERSSVYRGATREAAESAYHADARVMAKMGYAPTFEDWSTAHGEEVLTVGYLHAPERAPAVLKALADVETELAMSTAQPPPPGQGSRPGLEALRDQLKDTPEIPIDRQRLDGQRIDGGLPVIAAAIAIGFLLGAISDSIQILAFVSVFGLCFAGVWVGVLAALSMREGAESGRLAGLRPRRTMLPPLGR